MKYGSSTKRLTTAALMLVFGIVLPQLFHLTGIPQAGEIFLPMHIPVILTGFVIGGDYGFIIGVLTPLISRFVTGMPGTPRLPFMIGELAVYGLVRGLLYHNAGLKNKKLGGLITLVASMLAGRLFYAVMLFVAANLLNIKCGGAIAALTATVKGVYGIGIQLLVIPPIVYAAQKGGLIIERDRKGKNLLKDNVTFVAVSDKGTYMSEKRGVAPILEKIDEDPEFLKGASVADRVIGKAAAMLLYKYGVVEIYAQVTSEYAAAYLSDKRVNFAYDKKAAYIVNRSGADMCPMEKAVLNVNNADEGEKLIRDTINSMMKG